MSNVDWQTVLANIGDIPPERRLYRDTEDIYFGEPVVAGGRMHLGVARLRDRDIQQIDWVHGRIDHLQLEENRSIVDTTVVSFLPYGNIIGVLQGTMSAPRPSAVQRWLNSMDSGLDRDIAVVPLIGRNAREKLKRAEAINFFEVRLRPGPDLLDSDVAGLGDLSRRAHRHNPNALITLTMKIPKQGPFSRGTRRSRGESQLREDVLGFISQYASLVGEGGAVDRAIAHVVLPNGDGDLIEEKINFVSDHITAQRQVMMRRSEGGAPWHEAAVRAITQVATECERELRDAVSAVP
ncbi:hypothetical protein HUT16_16920 [Kitasatospora sp. NA04385]|uniref:hypothetical protein n=1 Tax=Kitasatospora sp. NA04385 TaxID=2742135 RepID=UPI00159170FD|nr:hypothetical protein [Kitasatospora sp. NA04385]QKW20522.1 hypothetical protein HUT16_16920 [Kitasatospora sp. NA04385]